MFQEKRAQEEKGKKDKNIKSSDPILAEDENVCTFLNNYYNFSNVFLNFR